MSLYKQLQTEYDNGIRYKQGRMEDWRKNEDLYLGKVKKSLRGRVNIPIPVMSGFVDTLLSKIDEPPTLNFIPGTEADYRASKKIQAIYEHDRTGVGAVDEADWHSKDIDNKKLNILYGRSIFKTRGVSRPEYRFDLFVTDPYDFYIDPSGGGYIEDANYMGEDGIYKTEHELKAMKGDKFVDDKAIDLLIQGAQENVENDDRFKNKANRFAALDLNIDLAKHFSGGAVRLIESGTMYKGERYYCLWSYDYGQIIRKCPIKELFKSNLWWWTSWASFRDKYNFWSKSPADDIRPLSEAMRILVNQELENRQKNNWGMRAYDSEMFPNPQELYYRPDGLIAADPNVLKTKRLDQGIYEFTVPGLNGTIDLVNWIDNFLGKKSGISADTQGQSEESKVGIYYGNLQQVADRLGLLNKSYSSCWRAIGRRYLWALKEHMPQKKAVKIMSDKGVEWTELVRQEVNPDMDIRVENTSAEIQNDEINKQRQSTALASLQANPNLAQKLNPEWVIEQTLKGAGFDEEEVRVATDTDRYANRSLLAEAAEAIDKILNGKEPKLNYEANTAYIEKIVTFARDNTDDDFELFNKLLAFADKHTDIAIANASRQLIREGVQFNNPADTTQEIPQGMPQGMPQMPSQEMMTNQGIISPEIPPNTPAGTASRSQLNPSAL